MILGILQARVSSTRLPGKVLKEILGVPMIVRQVERVRRSALVDRFVLATSTDASDDPLEQLCLENGVPCFRGSLEDVLDRFYQAAAKYKPDHVVRLTGDCPLADPDLIDEVIDFHLKGGFDYTSNALEPSFPDGLDVEVFRFSCLEKAWREAKRPSQREHVTLYMYQNPDLFNIGSFKNSTDRSSLRWTVDEPQDFEFISKIYKGLYHSNPHFTTSDVLAFLEENKELAGVNKAFQRNEGLRKSLSKES